MGRWVIAAGVAALMLAGCAGTKRYTEEDRAFFREHSRNADEAFNRGKWDEAGKEYDWLIRNAPDLVTEVHLAKRSAVYFLQKRHEVGLRFTKDVALRKFPHSPLVLEQQALMLWALRRHEESMNAANEAASLNPRGYQAQLLIGTYYYGRDTDRAANAFVAYLAHRPSALAERDAMPRLKLGTLYLARGDARRALDQFRVAKEQFAGKRRVTVNADNGLCAAYTALEDIERATTVCEAIVNEPRSIDRRGSAVFNLAVNYLRAERWDEALALAQRYGNDYMPNTAKSWGLLAEAHMGVGQCEEGERALEKAARRGAADAEVARLRDLLHGCREP